MHVFLVNLSSEEHLTVWMHQKFFIHPTVFMGIWVAFHFWLLQTLQFIAVDILVTVHREHICKVFFRGHIPRSEISGSQLCISRILLDFIKFIFKVIVKILNFQQECMRVSFLLCIFISTGIVKLFNSRLSWMWNGILMLILFAFPLLLVRLSVFSLTYRTFEFSPLWLAYSYILLILWLASLSPSHWL